MPRPRSRRLARLRVDLQTSRRHLPLGAGGDGHVTSAVGEHHSVPVHRRHRRVARLPANRAVGENVSPGIGERRGPPCVRAPFRTGPGSRPAGRSRRERPGRRGGWTMLRRRISRRSGRPEARRGGREAGRCGRRWRHPPRRPSPFPCIVPAIPPPGWSSTGRRTGISPPSSRKVPPPGRRRPPPRPAPAPPRRASSRPPGPRRCPYPPGGRAVSKATRSPPGPTRISRMRTTTPGRASRHAWPPPIPVAAAPGWTTRRVPTPATGTVTESVAEVFPRNAEMVAVPGPRAVTFPAESTIATRVSEDHQVVGAIPVREPSGPSPVAIAREDSPAASTGSGIRRSRAPPPGSCPVRSRCVRAFMPAAAMTSAAAVSPRRPPTRRRRRRAAASRAAASVPPTVIASSSRSTSAALEGLRAGSSASNRARRARSGSGPGRVTAGEASPPFAGTFPASIRWRIAPSP